ncbi:MAG: O-methyltransferase [Catenibacillus sp.]
MNVDERMITYIRSLDRGENALIRTIEQEALAEHVPIIRKETANVLKVLLRMKKPARILEVGAAVGFSSILMSEYIEENATITTIEKFEPRILKARENIRRAGKSHVITLLEGDALEIMKTLNPPFDFIFMDAAKGQYIHFLPEVMRLLAVGGVLVSDNVLQDGDIVESRYAVTRRNRTIHSRMREYLWELKHSDALEPVVLPVGDGMTISTRI